MEHMLLSRALWPTEGKCVPPHAGDGFASSVHVTRELPAGTVLGACVLHNDFYDTLAFIALKARDSRNNCYAFRVDPESIKSSPLALSWLRLVQAARDRAEQNTEAFLKAGQLMFRTLRPLQQEAELLVWYDEELARLLGLSDSRATPTSNGFCCVRCGQSFQYEHPYLAHCRFLCTHNKSDWLSREPQRYKPPSDWLNSEPQRYKPVSDWLNSDRRSHTHTDFHNIARDLERKGSSCPSKRRHDNSPVIGGRKAVLLEKDSNIPPPPAGGDGESQPITNTRQDTGGGVRKAATPTRDIVGVVKKTTPNGRSTEDRDGENLRDQTERGEWNAVTPERVLHSSVCVLRGKEIERRSAFCRPVCRRPTTADTHTHSRTDSQSHTSSNTITHTHFDTHTHSKSDTQSHTHSPSNTHTHSPTHILSNPTATLYSPPTQSDHTTLAFQPKLRLLGFQNTLGPALLYADLPVSQGSVQSGGPYVSEPWPSTPTPPNPPTTLALLPSSLGAMGGRAQNWCAKCSLAFRMTSDLVLHMRSAHHKREPESSGSGGAVESLKRRREERLSCPVCQEHFREKHHLSRHMTSHN